MSIALSQLLTTNRIQRFVEDALQDVRESSAAPMLWDSRIPEQSASDAEIIAKITGQVYLADIVANDAPAILKPGNKVRIEQGEIPNIKHGSPISQEALNTLEQINRLGAGVGSPELRSFDAFVSRTIGDLIQGVVKRVHMLKVAMVVDLLDYDANGIKLENMSFGMPSDLKLTPADEWSDATNSTPVTDILDLISTAQNKYNMVYNRVTMSRTAFRYMIASDEFQDLAANMMPAGFTLSAIPVSADGSMISVAEKVLGMNAARQSITIEIDDSAAATVSNGGTVSTERYLPEQYVVLTNSNLDGNPNIWRFANGVVTESIVSSILGGAGPIGGMPITEGPIGYATSPNVDMNPPQITCWGVQRGFPQKFVEAASARITAYTPA
jgi:hypothetical protein